MTNIPTCFIYESHLSGAISPVIVSSKVKMSAGQLCHQKVLFYFHEEGKTGIGPTWLIIVKDAAAVGAGVTVNEQVEHVPAKVIALSDKYSCNYCVKLILQLHLT